MPHLVEYPFDDDDFDMNRPVSPSSPYRRASAPTTSTSHAASTKIKSWWTGNGSPDAIPDIIDTSSSSRDCGFGGGAGYEDERYAAHDDPAPAHQTQPHRDLFGALPPMSPPSRNESSSTINSIPGGRGYIVRDLDGSDLDDYDSNSGKHRHLHPDPYHRHVPPPPIPSPSVRSVRSKQQRRSHRRSAVERRRSQQKHQQVCVVDDDLLYEQHRSSSSSSSGGAGTGGAASSHSHPSRASSHGGRRSSSHSAGSHRHSFARRSHGSAAALTKADKDRLGSLSSSGSAFAHAGKRGLCLSSPRTMFRMLSFAGILSVSLTVLANRNLLLVGDPNHPTSPLNANSVINWNSRDSFSLQYGNEHVSSSVSSSSSLSSSSSSSLFLQYPASAVAAAATKAAVAVAATAAAATAAEAASARLDSSTASSGMLRGKDKKSVSTSHKPADSATTAARSSSALTADQHRVRHLATGSDSRTATSPVHGSNPALLIPQHRSEGTDDQRMHLSRVVVPQGKLAERHFESQDRSMYTYHTPAPSTISSSSAKSTPLEAGRRVATLHESWKQHKAAAAAPHLGRGSPLTYPRRKLQLYPPDFTDPTQLYGILDSGDERVKMMERRPPLVQGECVPMREWQTTFHPSCNQLHESFDMARVGAKPQQSGSEMDLFGTKGYWRNAWKVNTFGPRRQTDTVVLKTLKIEHRFEEKVYEHNRIDAIAMERLTSSPHVINVFGFCGNSVVTEYADGKRLGELADKSKREPLARLRIARDIAQGLADVHGIDGDGNATFVHLDINPANVVSIGGTLKLNDFNIGIIRRWNVTSGGPCGFPAQYPNPQWRSPEEARGQSDLTEKVDVFSMGHIFFRLICGHEPWNKLEPGGKPSKAEVNEKVERGVLPTIPAEIRHSKDPEEVAIREAMLQCYVHDPAKRPSARKIARELQRALDRLESERQKHSVVQPPVE